MALFPGRPRPPSQSNKREQLSASVTSTRLGTINPIPIDYGCRPRLRDRLTLRGLTLRRNPWTSGERVSHPLYRYSCQHSRFRYLQHTSRCTFAGLRNAPLPLRRQESGIRDQNSGGSDPTENRDPAASWQSPDIRLAKDTTSSRRYIRDRSNNAPKHASHPPSPSPSSESV